MTAAESIGRRPAGYSPEVRLFGGLALAWLAGFAWFLLDRQQAGRLLPPGVLTVLLECVLEAWATANQLLGPSSSASATDAGHAAHP
jgi:hypothetical protein